jgi:hypothetical protein
MKVVFEIEMGSAAVPAAVRRALALNISHEDLQMPASRPTTRASLAVPEAGALPSL